MREDKPARPVSAEDLSLQITPVAVPIPQFTRDGMQFPNKTVLGFQVTQGALDLSQKPHVEGLKENDRLIIYIRTDKEILRIEPNGTVRKMDLGTGKIETLGELIGLDPVAIEVGKSAKVPCNIASEGNMPGHLPAIYIQDFRIGEVQEVLIRTSREPSDDMVGLPITDTALIMGNPKGFRFSPIASPTSIN
ncbi:hypothetical protein A3A64_02135 [Candidatus Gottesmanbacteria bacterium RIFCSPLOWO2_01_FULL_48_11]|uniref:Uncharacterized protein n=1 Tax=Candidatus Gottesmanbacteria bacterium RIFCSPLOWO2_01_FULL_48_11 TaxID=1798395 RepID=A0A1F6AR31_9BACT|nr:MAG: hypothetical protein A3A64_02135 [Candidatus Gottesmanbacteria bacterium RIFCSPLOWO2_01_FULL_48_11]